MIFSLLADWKSILDVYVTLKKVIEQLLRFCCSKKYYILYWHIVLH